jgi:hypothetical protein
MGAELIDLPVQLVEHVARGYCVLFLGSDADMSTPEWAGPPTRAQLAAALAERYDWVGERQDLRLAAEEYLSKDPPDEHGLRSFVKDQVEAGVSQDWGEFYTVVHRSLKRPLRMAQRMGRRF